MIVIGAGMAGLLANSMLRDNVTAIFEKQSSLPNNHSALLRFRSPVVGDVTGIPFRKVRVMKAISPWKNPVADALAYSYKCTGEYSLRSSVSGNGEIEERYIAPHDFISQLGKQAGTKIAFDRTLQDLIQYRAARPSKEPIVSTMPMPVLMDILKYQHNINFGHTAGGTISFDVEGLDVCATLYFPDPRVAFYRGSITGSRVILETSDSKMIKVINPTCVPESGKDYVLDQVNKATDALGIGQHLISYKDLDGVNGRVEFGSSHYAKIVPISEGERKRFILWASENHNIYSLGRFATWRPTLLLDDVVNDVRVIQSLTNGNMEARYFARMENEDG